MKKGLAKNEIAKILIGAVWVVLGVIVFFIPDILEASYHVSYLTFEQSNLYCFNHFSKNNCCDWYVSVLVFGAEIHCLCN